MSVLKRNNSSAKNTQLLFFDKKLHIGYLSQGLKLHYCISQVFYLNKSMNICVNLDYRKYPNNISTHILQIFLNVCTRLLQFNHSLGVLFCYILHSCGTWQDNLSILSCSFCNISTLQDGG